MEAREAGWDVARGGVQAHVWNAPFPAFLLHEAQHEGWSTTPSFLLYLRLQNELLGNTERTEDGVEHGSRRHYEH
uniref:DUF4158 domain-containing protein n=1 Tax=Steinernema glaseri TaxID=37863 RepID=A0A1I8A7I8_9BILA